MSRRAAIAKGVPTEVAFFGRATAERLAARGSGADLIAANNVLAHVPDIRDFVGRLRCAAEARGRRDLRIPASAQPDPRRCSSTRSTTSTSPICRCCRPSRSSRATGLRVFDVETLPTHGGSLRLFVCRAGASHRRNRAARSRCAPRSARPGSARSPPIAALPRASRRSSAASSTSSPPRAPRASASPPMARRPRATRFSTSAASTPRTSSASSTAARPSRASCCPAATFRFSRPRRSARSRPDYLVVLPWNLIDEIRAQMAVIGEWGGRFVVALPELAVIAP